MESLQTESDTATSIEAYRQAVDDLSKKLEESEDSKILAALLARDRVALTLNKIEVTPAIFASLVEADDALKAAAQTITKGTGQRLAKLRDNRSTSLSHVISHTQTLAWWWHLDSRLSTPKWRTQGINYLLWIGIVVSLSFIVESLRRFLSVEVGVLGTVLKGIVTLLVGGALLEVARMVSAIRSGNHGEATWRSLKGRAGFTAFLTVMAFVMWFLIPRAVTYYSNRGVTERSEGLVSNPIDRFQRVISLEPSDAIGHYNLARAYEAILAYEEAETEYKASLRWNADLVPAYDGLARLVIVRRNDFGAALKLMNVGLTKLEAQRAAKAFPNEGDYVRLKVSMLKIRAWAYFGLHYLLQAEDDLRTAIELNADAAAPQCLLGQVLDEKMKLDGTAAAPQLNASRQAYERCIALSFHQDDRIEAEWLARAQERINQEDPKDHSQVVKSKRAGRAP